MTTLNSSEKTGPLPTHLILPGVVVCFVLSGFAALLYQTAWMRQFSLVFGTSELAVAAVLSAYMGGLALGAAIAAKFVHRVIRPIWFYGLLESGIAISALAVPVLLKLSSYIYTSVFGDQPNPVDASGFGQSFFYLAVAFVVLAIPTCFMGATLPLLIKYVVQSKEQIGTRVGLLYATNTVGAIGGTLVAAFLLLPSLGLNGTVYVGVAINIVVFGIAALIAKSVHMAHSPTMTPDKAMVDPKMLSGKRWWILPIMLLSGVASFIYEVLWTRLLGHILGGSISAFAIMLASFLGGIAIGSAIASRFARTEQEATRWFIVAQCGIAVTSMFIYQLMPLATNQSELVLGKAALAFAILVPATLCIGATFPLAVRMLTSSAHEAGPSSAKVYSWNTVGAIFGATLAAFYLIPALKYEGAVKFVVLLNIFLALGTATMLGRQFKSLIVGAAILGLGVGILYRPSMPEAILRSSPLYAYPEGDIRFYEVGRSATVLVVEKGGFFNLSTNGLPEASTRLKGSPPDPNTQRLLGTLPVLARPDTKAMLIVGLGAGAAVEGVPQSVRSIDVVELEPEVVNANRIIGDEREIDPLTDPRVKLIINDARSAMMLTSKRYDAIVSQPSHPWTAGASHLYTREYMTLARERLADEGVYLQWMNTQFVDEALLRDLCATVLDVFPYVRVYHWNSEVLFFLGSEAPLDVEQAIARTGRPLSDAPLAYLANGIGSVEDIVAAVAMEQDDVERFAQGANIITDNDNRMATRSAQVIGTPSALRVNKLYELLNPYDPMLNADSDLRGHFPIPLDYSYVSRRLGSMGLRKRSIDLANSLLDANDPQALAIIGLGQYGQGETREAEKNLRLALEVDPTNQQARYALLQPHLQGLLANAEPPEFFEKELKQLSGTSLATLQGIIARSQGDLNKLVQLDSILASVLPSDLWYEMSVKLRAEWRIRLTTPGLQPRMANDAISLIDSVIVFHPNQELHIMRLEAAVVAEDANAIIETSRRLLYIIDKELSEFEKRSLILPTEIANSRLERIRRVEQVIENLLNHPEAAVYKLQILKASAQTSRHTINALNDHP